MGVICKETGGWFPNERTHQNWPHILKHPKCADNAAIVFEQLLADNEARALEDAWFAKGVGFIIGITSAIIIALFMLAVYVYM